MYVKILKRGIINGGRLAGKLLWLYGRAVLCAALK